MEHVNKVAVVTGGSRGIGLGIAMKLVKSGFSMVITGRRSVEDARQSLEELRQAGEKNVRVEYVQSDVTDSADRKNLITETERMFGRLDVLVNNAGVAPRTRADVLDASEDSFDELISTNLKGPYFLTQAIARWMVRQQSADAGRDRCIINISSVSATVASVNRGDYCISKAGIAMATKIWAARLSEHGINVYEVRPGIIETDMTAGIKAKYDALIEDGLLLEKRWGRPEDVGAAVAMLARGELPYSPGAVLILDGGMTLPRL